MIIPIYRLIFCYANYRFFCDYVMRHRSMEGGALKMTLKLEVFGFRLFSLKNVTISLESCVRVLRPSQLLCCYYHCIRIAISALLILCQLFRQDVFTNRQRKETFIYEVQNGQLGRAVSIRLDNLGFFLMKHLVILSPVFSPKYGSFSQKLSIYIPENYCNGSEGVF